MNLSPSTIEDLNDAVLSQPRKVGASLVTEIGEFGQWVDDNLPAFTAIWNGLKLLKAPPTMAQFAAKAAELSK